MKNYLALLLPIFCLTACGGKNEQETSHNTLSPEQQAVWQEYEQARDAYALCGTKNLGNSTTACEKESEQYITMLEKVEEMCKAGTLKEEYCE